MVERCQQLDLDSIQPRKQAIEGRKTGAAAECGRKGRAVGSPGALSGWCDRLSGRHRTGRYRRANTLLRRAPRLGKRYSLFVKTSSLIANCRTNSRRDAGFATNLAKKLALATAADLRRQDRSPARTLLVPRPIPSGEIRLVSSNTLTIAVGGSASSAGGTNNAPDTLAEDYAQLITNGSNFFQGSSADVLVLQAGAMSMASPAQIGRVINGVTITAATVQQNQQVLDAISTYCRANGISIQVEAQLDTPPQDDWTYQWLIPAATANLPITGVENDDEVAVSVPETDYSAVAQNMTAIVKQIVQYYPNVQIGQWEGGSTTTATADWWATYDAAATAAGLPIISYAVADTSWDAPWVTPPASWQNWLTNLSNLVQSNGMQLEVLLDGTKADASDQQWTAQSEQDAAMLAELSGITVNTLLVESWSPPYPDSVLPINTPTTIGNDAAEIAATYPLYQSGSITAEGPVTLTMPPQLVIQTGTAGSLGPLSLEWTAADVTAGAKLAIVLIDETGLLSATPAAGGTVSGAGSNELILNGDAGAISAELETLSVTETVSGPDSIDIEAFGANGRLADGQITVLALPANAGAGEQTYTFPAAGTGQPWTSATASVNGDGVITSEGFTWNSTDQNAATGQYQIIKTDSVHEPLAESGVTLVNGVVEEPPANPSPNSDASLPLNLANWNGSAFNPSTQLDAINVLNTVMTYGANGALQTISDTLAPTTPTAAITGGSLVNYFAAGGTQVTQFNTGDNPNWQTGWSATLASVTTTYGSNGQVLEQVFQGGASDPYFVLDNVFDPYTGALWEQIETVSPPSPYSTFVTGDEYVTEFNTGDNPNWDYTDWGNNAQVTVTWQDYYAIAVGTTAPVATGLQVTDAYNFVSASSGIDNTTSIYNAGHSTIYTTPTTTTIDTGSGGCLVYLSQISQRPVTITSGGGDTIETWLGNLAITNAGNLADTIYATGIQLSVEDYSQINLIGGSNSINVGSACTITANSSGNSLSLLGNSDTVTVGNSSTIAAGGAASGGSFNLNGTADVAQIGNSNTVTLNGSGGVVTGGNSDSAWVWGAGETVSAGDSTMAWLLGAGDTLVAGNKAVIDLAGRADVCNLAASSVVWEYGNGSSATLQADGTIDLFGTNEVGVGGTGTNGWLAGSNNRLSTGDMSTVDVVGIFGTVTVGNSSTITVGGTASGGSFNLNGTADVAQIGNSNTVTLGGSQDIVNGGSHVTATVIGNGDTVTAGSNGIVSLLGNSDTVTVGNSSTITTSATANDDTIALAGVGDYAQMGNGGLAFISGSQDTIAIDAVGGSQTINGFQLTKGNKLDLTQILAGVPSLNESTTLGKYLSVTDVGSNAIVSITEQSIHDAITLTGVGAIGLSDLVSHSVLILPVVS